MLVALLAVPLLMSAGTFDSTYNAAFQDGITAFGTNPFTADWRDIVTGLSWGLGYFGMPHIIVRFMSIEKPSMMKKAATVAIIWVVLTLGAAIAIAILARTYIFNDGTSVAGTLLPVGAQQNIFITIVQKLFPGFIAGLLLAAIIAAAMSTADSQLLVASSSFTSDLYKPMIRKNKASDKELLWVGRIVVLVVAVIAYFIASSTSEGASSIMDMVGNAWGGFGSGKKVVDLMFEQIDRLESVGVKVWWVGHVKTKEVKNIYNDETYQVLTSDQQQNYFNALKKNLHFLCLAYFDRELQKEKTGKKNIVTKKEEIKTTIKDETRKIKFRDDSFVVDSGSRFSDIVTEIDLDRDAFITAITDAIKAEINKNGVSVEERKRENDKEDAEKQKRIAEAEEAARVEKKLNEIKAKIIEFITANKTDMNVIKPVLEVCRENGFGNPTEIDNIEAAEKVLAACNK